MELNNNSKKVKLKTDSIDKTLMNTDGFILGMILGTVLLLVAGTHLFFMWKNELKVHYLREEVSVTCTVEEKEEDKTASFSGENYLYLIPKGYKVKIKRDVPEDVYSIVEKGEEITVKVEKYKLSTQDLLWFKENKPGVFWNTFFGLVIIVLCGVYLWAVISGDDRFYPECFHNARPKTWVSVVGISMLVFPVAIILTYIIYWIY